MSNLKDSTLPIPEIISGKHSEIKRPRSTYQVMEVNPQARAETAIELNLDVDNLSREYTDLPVTGATQAFTDGEIMEALEEYGDNLDYTLKSAAKKLGVPFVKFMYRVMGTQVLVTYLGIIRRIRAQSMAEERDRIFRECKEQAENGMLDKMIWAVEQKRLASLEKEMAKLDQYLYGTLPKNSVTVTSVNGGRKGTEFKNTGLVISTTFQD